MSPVEFLLALMQLYSRYPFSETSGQRTPQRNLDVDGVTYSPHQYWVGRDLIFDDAPAPEDLENAAGRLGLKLIRERDHYHVQPADWLPG